MNLEPIILSEVNQREKDKYYILHIYRIQKDGNSDKTRRGAKDMQMQRTDFRTQWEKARVG